MSDLQRLERFSAEELLAELRVREAKLSANTAVINSEVNEELQEFDSETLVKVLEDRQEIIYGGDDRADLFTITNPAILKDANSVVALFKADKVIDNGNGTSTLVTQNFGSEYNLCSGVKFREQPCSADCSGFLIAPDIVATAGHCVTKDNVTNRRFVFGFRMLSASTAQTVINNAEIYRGVAVIGRHEASDGADWALVRLDRPVPNHPIAQPRKTGKVANNQAVHIIGHPVGLPLKVADKAIVLKNSSNAFFAATLDAFGGNSGSPVFNSSTHEVEGVLVRGGTDFKQQGSCRVAYVCTTGCEGEDCTRTTEFATENDWILEYDTKKGDVFLEKANANSQGTATVWSGKWASGYQIIAIGDNRVLEYNPTTGKAWIERFNLATPNQAPTQKWSGQWATGYRLTALEKGHVLEYNPNSGKVWIEEYDEGSNPSPVGLWQGQWLPGYTIHYLGDDRLVEYNPSDGKVWIERLNDKFQGTTTVSTDHWGANISSLVSIDYNRILCYQQATGAVAIRQINQNGVGSAVIWSAQWRPKLSLARLLNNRLIEYDPISGKVWIEKVNANGIGTTTLWSSQWSTNKNYSIIPIE